MAELRKVIFHYSLSGVQQFTAAEMTKRESFFELTLNDLVSDTLYHYYYEMFPNSGNVSTTEQKTFHTLAIDAPLLPTPPAAELPTVITSEVSEITVNSAVCGGEVTNDGGAEVTERGICWSTNANPTISDSHVSDGNGIGTFSAAMSGLQANTTYHVRAYATNSTGTVYGLDKEFVTLAANGNAPIGAIDGLFTINENGDQVYFSHGNLQYQASTNTWRFAENQWDYVGDIVSGTVFENGVKCDNALISSTYDGWIDLFGWGTSGWDNGNLYYQPFDTAFNLLSPNYGYGYGPTDGTNCAYSLVGDYANADWGVYNPISNGGNTANTWRTLTSDEWVYVFNTRTTSSGLRYAKACVNNVNGVILLPDDWSASYYSLSNGGSFTSNTISATQWTTLEQHGAVFLPAAGVRGGSSVYDVGSGGNYWSASYEGSSYAYYVYFGGGDSYVYPQYINDRSYGFSVRLVRSAQ